MTTVCYNVLQYTCTYVTYMLHQSVSLTRQHNLFLKQHTCARCCSHEYISKQRASVGRLLRYLFLPCPYPVLSSTEQESCNHNVNKHNLQLISIPGLEKKPARSSRTSRYSLWASNLLSFLARWATTLQASRSPTKFLITILRRKGKL